MPDAKRYFQITCEAECRDNGGEDCAERCRRNIAIGKKYPYQNGVEIVVDGETSFVNEVEINGMPITDGVIRITKINLEELGKAWKRHA